MDRSATLGDGSVTHTGDGNPQPWGWGWRVCGTGEAEQRLLSFMVDFGILWGYHGELMAIIWATYGPSRVNLGSIWGHSKVSLA